MKVAITYREIIRRENIVEVEMTKDEFKDYLKMSEYEKEQKYQLCARTDDGHHIGTEALPIYAEIIDAEDDFKVGQRVNFRKGESVVFGKIVQIKQNSFIVITQDDEFQLWKKNPKLSSIFGEEIPFSDLINI